MFKVLAYHDAFGWAARTTDTAKTIHAAKCLGRRLKREHGHGWTIIIQGPDGRTWSRLDHGIGPRWQNDEPFYEVTR